MKLTSSMKMISTVKMQKFMKSSANAIPWWQATDEIFNNVNSVLNKNILSQFSTQTQKERTNKVLIYVISSDRGLCGRFNASVIETTEKVKTISEEKGLACSFIFIGKKAIRYFSKRKADIINSYEIGKIQNFANFAREISYDAIAKFINGDFSEIYLIRTKKL
ncbi:MAG TPA: F0F1 ATP synthase subunit gamma, partial [Victivallales bacterium]|nr:F0F1 ATP synthase subunit gamma [Victivallales bacterium]